MLSAYFLAALKISPKYSLRDVKLQFFLKYYPHETEVHHYFRMETKSSPESQVLKPYQKRPNIQLFSPLFYRNTDEVLVQAESLLYIAFLFFDCIYTQKLG